MQDKIIDTLKDNNWIGTATIAKLLDTDSKTLSPIMKTMVSEDKLITVGARRWVKYALPGTPENAGERDFRPEVIGFITKQGKAVSRLDICTGLSTDAAKVYDSQIMAVLKPLVEEGLIESNNAKKGQLFWSPGVDAPAGGGSVGPIVDTLLELLRGGAKVRRQLVEASGSYDVKVKRVLDELIEQGKVQTNGQKRNTAYWLTDNDNDSSDINIDNGKPTIDSLDKLIEYGVSNMPEKVGYLQTELRKLVDDSANHPFDALELGDAIVKTVKDGMFGLQYQSEYSECGYYIKVYRGNMPSLD